MKWYEKKVMAFKRLKTSRKISILMLVGILIGGQIGVILYLVASSETLDIIASTVVPSGTISINFDTTQPQDMEVCVPYTVRNPGLFDLTGIVMNVDVKVVYVHNTTKEVVMDVFFSKMELLGTCFARSVLTGEFAGDFPYFDTGALGRFFLYADAGESWAMLGDISLTAAYFSSLVHFDVIQNNLVFA